MGIDPVGFSDSNLQSFNKYAYANNNPYKYVDPNGESPLDLAFLAVDHVKLGGAIRSGEGVGGALVDVGFSVVGVISPVPGVGQIAKAGVIAGKATKVADKVSDATKKVHGNSKTSTKEQHLYMIQDADGNIKKVGVSGQELNKNGTSPRANSQLKDGDTATVLERGIPGRANVLQKEGQAVEGLRKAGHELPDQKRPKI